MGRYTAFLLLFTACAPHAAGVFNPNNPLQGSVWWNRAQLQDEGCERWTFVPHRGFTSLERTVTETGEGWKRRVRTFYNIIEDGTLYAPGYDYSWIVRPGPNSTSFPMERGAQGYVSGFSILEQSPTTVRWMESGWSSTPQTWHQSQAACEAHSAGR